MKEYNLKSGNILRVIQDTDAESPRTWENKDIFLVYDHKQFNIKKKGFEPKNIWDHLYDERFEDNTYDDYFIFLVDAYIHSGIHLSLNNTKSYPDIKWDVSSTGFILVNKYHISDKTGYSWNEKYHKDKTDVEIAKILAEGLIETWNQYLSGDVYGFQVLKPYKTHTITEESLNEIVEDGYINKSRMLEITEEKTEYEEINSCWGFYGENPKTNGMLDNIDDELLN